jgi:NAD(P)-dependent dehydrogenase (short-subunit alcohol dehydrogenase family)
VSTNQAPDRPPPLADRVVLVTGAESGIGRATALRAADAGADIAAIGLDRSGLDALADAVRSTGRRAAWRAADVSDADALTPAVSGLVDELGRLDVAYANAGVLIQATPFDELDLAEWHRVLAVNLTGVLHTFRATVPCFGADGGVLLATGSSTAIRPVAGILPYVAAKAGVHAIARSLAVELAGRNIRVNVVAPGVTDTAMTRDIPGHIERGLTKVPLGRLVTAEEVAALAVYLMTDDARSITGSVFTVDGGRTAG